ncbi:MAG: hypothetical protein IPM96_13990 [Ignavibacteria bacterium]|nr:hypothetical protein [Ignavibacteria bacterium]
MKGWLGSPHFTGPTIFRTTNSGSNWLPFFPSTQSTSNSIFFINSIKGWACGTNGVIIFTNNGGINWSHQLPFMPNKIYNSIYFTDSLTAG